MRSGARRSNCVERLEEEEVRSRWGLVDVRVNPYGLERLVYLLRLLRAAPLGWVIRAQRIAVDMGVLRESDLAELGQKLESDPMFRQRFDSDPVAAAEETGMGELALRLKWEMRHLVALAERIANDDVFRSELDADPVAALVAAGMPAGAAVPLLHALAVRDDVLAKLPDVAAHQHEQVPRKERLLMLLLRSSAAVEKLRTTTTGA
jgi:putative modified peptide